MNSIILNFAVRVHTSRGQSVDAPTEMMATTLAVHNFDVVSVVPIDLAALAENAAALSGAVHGDARYGEFYDVHSPGLSGFPGIWRYVAECASILIQQEQAGSCDPDEWIEVIEAIAEQILQSPPDSLTPAAAAVTRGIATVVQRRSVQ